MELSIYLPACRHFLGRKWVAISHYTCCLAPLIGSQQSFISHALFDSMTAVSRSLILCSNGNLCALKISSFHPFHKCQHDIDILSTHWTSKSKLPFLSQFQTNHSLSPSEKRELWSLHPTKLAQTSFDATQSLTICRASSFELPHLAYVAHVPIFLFHLFSLDINRSWANNHKDFHPLLPLNIHN